MSEATSKGLAAGDPLGTSLQQSIKSGCERKEKKREERRSFNHSLGLRMPRGSSLWQAAWREDKSLPPFVLDLIHKDLNTCFQENQTREDCVYGSTAKHFYS